MIAEPPPKLESPAPDLIDWSLLAASLRPSAYRSIRYILDWVGALVLLVLLSPLMLLIALAIRLDSPGPVFFRQVRAGRYARPFMIIKFRTMRTSAPRSSLKVSNRDPNVTRVGRLLRKTGLDEVPQLFNVIRGDMVLIGPRPEQIGLLALYEPWQHERHLVKPGITGWWQIHHRDSVPMHLNIEKDIHYVRHMSLALDAQVIWGTANVLVSPLLPANRRATAPSLSVGASPEASDALGGALLEEPAS